MKEEGIEVERKFCYKINFNYFFCETRFPAEEEIDIDIVEIDIDIVELEKEIAQLEKEADEASENLRKMLADIGI